MGIYSAIIVSLGVWCSVVCMCGMLWWWDVCILDIGERIGSEMCVGICGMG